MQSQRAPEDTRPLDLGDEWPLTGSGKIQKFKLAEQFERREQAQG